MHPNEAKKIARQLLSALEYIHSLDIVHRDVKLENILIKNFDNKVEDMSVRLCDFGYAVQLSSSFGNIKSMTGSLNYMAPEVIRRSVQGTELDVWSAGVVIFILITGHMPFVGSNRRDVIGQVLTKDVDFLLAEYDIDD